MATTGNANKPEQSPSPQNEAITRPLGPPKQIDRVPKPPKPPPAPSTFKFPHDAPSPSRGLAFGGEEAPPSVAEQPIAHIPTHKRLPTSDAGKNTINGDLSVASTGKDSKPQGKSSNPSTPAVQARNALIFIGMVLVVTIISVALFQFRFTNVLLGWLGVSIPLMVIAGYFTLFRNSVLHSARTQAPSDARIASDPNTRISSAFDEHIDRPSNQGDKADSPLISSPPVSETNFHGTVPSTKPIDNSTDNFSDKPYKPSLEDKQKKPRRRVGDRRSLTASSSASSSSADHKEEPVEPLIEIEEVEREVSPRRRTPEPADLRARDPAIQRARLVRQSMNAGPDTTATLQPLAEASPEMWLGTNGDPDVLLSVPNLGVDRIYLSVDNLNAHVDLHARVLDLLELHVGADVGIRRVELEIDNVRVQAILKVRLNEVEKIIGRVVDLLEHHPEILSNLTGGLGRGLEAALTPRERAAGRWSIPPTTTTSARPFFAQPGGELSTVPVPTPPEAPSDDVTKPAAPSSSSAP